MYAVGKPADAKLASRDVIAVIVAELIGLSYENVYGPVAGVGPSLPEIVNGVAGVLTG